MTADSPPHSSSRKRPRRLLAPRFSRRIPSGDAATSDGRSERAGPCVRRIAKRPAVPLFWTDIAPLLRRQPLPPAIAPADRERYWLLVLEAKGMPRATAGRGSGFKLYVPPVAAKAAAHEILAFERERPDAPLPAQPVKPLSDWVFALVAALILWHRMRWSGSPQLPGMPADPQQWLALGGLDAYRVKAAGEWWRCVTALTLHADEAHLISNVVTGGLFCLPLCRRVGLGAGFLLTVLGGALGNATTVLFRPPSYLSQGFSTAVFAAVGLLAAVSACHTFRHTLGVARAVSARTDRAGLRRALKKAAFAAALPLGAGLGFLAMLGGSDAPRVDYLAHVMGLFCGMLLGLAAGTFAPRVFRLKGTADAALQAACLAAALGMPAFCWTLALR